MALPLGRLVVAALLIWVLVLLYISGILVELSPKQSKVGSGAASQDSLDAALLRLKLATDDIETLRKQNQELKTLLYQTSAEVANKLSNKNELPFPPNKLSGVDKLGHMSPLHEQLRRKIKNDIHELWYFVTGEIGRINKTIQWDKLNPHTKTGFRRLIGLGAEQFHAAMATMEDLSEVDGAQEFRARKLANLTKLVQKRLHYLQHPSDCRQVRKTVCNVNKGCGFGCQLHHATYCLMVSYGLKRTMLFEADGRTWRYSSRGWNAIYQPVSNCSYNLLSSFGQVPVPISGETQQDAVVSLPIIDSLSGTNRVRYLPLSFPEEFADDLLQYHGYPPAWWIGQFLFYLMRANSGLADRLTKDTKDIINGDPIVGLHVRRTDKLAAEAQLHLLSEYMQWAEHFFDIVRIRQRRSAVRKRCYIASDDATVLTEARRRYPDYVFYGDEAVMRSAGVEDRYKDDSTYGVIKDVVTLSQTDYLACTFSSQVCRLAYELMQVQRGDYADRFHSLDDVFYFGGQTGHAVEAILDHDLSPLLRSANFNELTIVKGDRIELAGNHWDGYSRGKLRRRSQQPLALFPSYKAKEVWTIVPYPTYAEVPP